MPNAVRHLLPLLGVVVGASMLAARGESLAAFDGRCIPSGCVASPSNIPDILGRRALPAGRLARLCATPDSHHGLLASAAQTTGPHPGQAPYDRACKVCHGEDGQGNAGPRLVPFTMDVDELLIRVREGGGEMPPISENRVSDDEVKQIAAYLESLKPPNE